MSPDYGTHMYQPRYLWQLYMSYKEGNPDTWHVFESSRIQL